MITFIFGALTGFFLSFIVLMLFTGKTINLAGFQDKSEDPKRYWTFITTYLSGALAMVLLYLYFGNF